MHTLSEEFTRRFSKGCAIPSVSADKESCRKMADEIKATFEDIGANVQLFTVSESSNPIVWAEIGVGEHCLMIYCHYDVQPAEPVEKWTYTPFGVTQANGNMYGRGTCDSKGNFYANVEGLKRWISENGPLPLRIVFLVEGEEEIGSPSLQKFTEDHKDLFQNIDLCLFPGETTARDVEENIVLTTGYKGIFYCQLEAEGPKSDVHSSYATLVENPAWRLVEALNTLKNSRGDIAIEGISEKVRKPTKREKEYMKNWPFEEEKVKKNYGVDHFVNYLTGDKAKAAHMFQPTCNICGINSGSLETEGMKTIVPSRATARLDFRLVPDLTPDYVEDCLRKHLDDHGFEDIAITRTLKIETGYSDLDSPLFRNVDDAIRKTYKKDPVYLVRTGGSGPQYYICTQFGIPIFVTGVGYYGSLVHAPDEHVREKDMADHITFMEEFIGTFV